MTVIESGGFSGILNTVKDRTARIVLDEVPRLRPRAPESRGDRDLDSLLVVGYSDAIGVDGDDVDRGESCLRRLGSMFTATTVVASSGGGPQSQKVFAPLNTDPGGNPNCGPYRATAPASP